MLTHSPTMMGPTVGGVLLGTAPYMSPEQARGKAVDKRTDIWAFGCVLYEILTGRRAFKGDTTTDVLAAIVDREPEWGALPASISPTVIRLLRRCLEKDPKQRLRDIGDVRVELTDAIAAPSSTTTVTGSSPRRVSRWAPWLVAGMATLTAAGFAVQLRRAQSSHDPLTDASVERLTYDAGLTMMPASRRMDGCLRTRRIAPAAATSTSGYNKRLVAPEGRRPRFSPDGSRIAYYTGGFRGSPSGNYGSSIFVVALGGGAPVRILPNLGPEAQRQSVEAGHPETGVLRT